MNKSKEIGVYADWDGLETPQFIGTLYASHVRGKEIFSFEYSKNWLQSSFAQEIDPDLGLYSGIQYMRDEKNIFGVFLDSSLSKEEQDKMSAAFRFALPYRM